MADKLRDRLILAIEDAPTIADAADLVDDHVLPIIAEHIAAAVAAERERIAAGLQRLARHVMDTDIQEGLELLDVLASGRLPALDTARIAREETVDG